METTIKVRAVQSLMKDIDKGKITFDSYLQRKPDQWKPADKSKLIDSLLNGYPIPPVYCVAVDGGLSVIDGCQRLTTINSFVNNKLKLKQLDDEELNGLKFKKLTEEQQDKVLSSEIQVVTLSDCTGEDIIETFDRLNNGVLLSKAQKNKVVMGYELSKTVSELSAHPVLSELGLTKGQIKKDEDQMVLCQALMLLVKGEGDFSAKSVKSFLEEYAAAEDKSAVDSLRAGLDKLAAIKGENDFKAVKKSMVAPLLYVVAGLEGKKLDTFGKKFNKFVAAGCNDEAYTQFTKSQTTSKDNVSGRINYFKELSN